MGRPSRAIEHLRKGNKPPTKFRSRHADQNHIRYRPSEGGGMNAYTPVWQIILGIVAALALWGTIIYVAVHFIAKFW